MQGYERLTETIAMFRRELAPDLVFSLVDVAGETDFTFAQLAALYLLDGRGDHTVSEIAQGIGRSLSATSRLLDQLVRKGFVGRQEDDRDRRAKRVFATDQGRALLRALERRRAQAQVSLMSSLSPADLATVRQAMTLLAEAARRRSDATKRERRRSHATESETAT